MTKPRSVNHPLDNKWGQPDQNDIEEGEDLNEAFCFKRRSSILQIIDEYDSDQQEYIQHLEFKNKALEQKIFDMINQNLKDAEEANAQLLKAIILGTISKPKDT